MHPFEQFIMHKKLLEGAKMLFRYSLKSFYAFKFAGFDHFDVLGYI